MSICNDGKNKKNIQKRVSKGMGAISQIMNILALVSFGHHYVEIALLLRESLFVSTVLSNVEVRYGLTNAEIESLDKLDLILLRKILTAPISTPKEAFYLELGILPLSTVLKQRRINYIHYLMTRDKTEMLSKFFWVQWQNPVKNDWTLTVRQDLADFGMSADPENIRKFSKNTFKGQVKGKAKEYAFFKLMSQKSMHSKMNNLSYSELQLQSYFTLPELSIAEMRRIFLFRVRMNQFADNFRGVLSISRLCPMCNLHNDNQNLLAKCKSITEQFKGSIQSELNDIYSERIVISSAKKLIEVLRFREKTMQENNIYNNIVISDSHSGPSAQ